MHRLKEHLKALPSEDEMVSVPQKVRAIGQIECLALTVGAVPVECAALVVGECVPAPLVPRGRAGARPPRTPGAKMKFRKHVRIEIEYCISAAQASAWPFRQREGGREGGGMHSVGPCWGHEARTLPCRWSDHRISPRMHPLPSFHHVPLQSNPAPL